VKAAYNDAKRFSENAWNPKLQSALKTDVYDADELREKIRTSILKLPQKDATNSDADSRTRLDNDVLAILIAAAFERFAMYRSQTPAGKATTKSEIKTLATLTGRLLKHIESMHQTSRELVGETLPIDQLQLLKRSAECIAVAAKDIGSRLADVPFREKSSGRKINSVAESVSRTAAAIFRNRTGLLPGRTTDRITGKPGGPFIEWLAELFSFLKIKASADAEARKYLKQARMETTAEK
jgi:hypothetical protein